MEQFTCQHCKSKKLAYRTYAKSTWPIQILEDGTLYHQEPVIDMDDFLPAEFGFCCGDCGQLIVFCGQNLETEQDLINYLSLSVDHRNQLQSEYDEMELENYESLQQEQDDYSNNIF